MDESPAKFSKCAPLDVAVYGPGARIAVLLPLPLPGPYDYLVANDMTLRDGDVVRVSLGRRSVAGVVWGGGDEQGVASSKLKSIDERLLTPSLPLVSRQFVDWVAAYTLSPPGAVLKMVISVPDALVPPKSVLGYALNPSPPDIKITSARARVFDLLKGGVPPLTPTDLAHQAAVGPSVIRGLAKAGALLAVQMPSLQPVRRQPDWAAQGPVLSEQQTRAGDDLAAKAAAGGFSVTLLDGVPGSGKTEVYFQAVAEALKRDRQSLVLLPEIALSAQWMARFVDRFGAEPAVWHSDLSPALRRDTWRDVATGRAKVVVGARSALLLPFPDLGLIVVDEEHESAFKQEEGVIYNARDMAIVRARLSNIPAVLASATPSLETVVNMEAGRYQFQHLPDRHADAELPEISLIDMRADAPPGGQWLSPVLKEALTETFAAGEQAMLFLNRRGYAPLTLCRTCGHRFQCPNCTAWLVEHRRAQGNRLQCHHCGYGAPTPKQCPSCDKEGTFAACGPGVQRLAEEVALAFPEIRMEIAASDTVCGPAAAAALVARIENHEIDLVVGTQIVAKGYHFPMLTLVGVVDADLGLTGGDLRAAERTFQLLYQVAGRAGRAQRPGRVLLQTYMPDHMVMQALKSGERDRFIAAESKARKEAGMPPFGRLGALIISGGDAREVDAAAAAIGRAAPDYKSVLILGPAPAPLAMVRGQHRRRFLIRADKSVNMQRLIADWLASVEVSRKVRVKADIDPYSFM